MQDQLEKRLDREIISVFKRATTKHSSTATKVSSYSDLFNNKRAIILWLEKYQKQWESRIDPFEKYVNHLKSKNEK